MLKKLFNKKKIIKKKTTINLIKEDITKLTVDIIVNAANNSLLGGGGVDGAIHQAAGYSLLEECKLLNGCNTGSAKITKAYKLNAKYIIHTVGPDMKKYTLIEGMELLEKSYKETLMLAEEHKAESIAFPCISTGVYSFPNQLAAHLAYKNFKNHIENSKYLKKIYICCFTDLDYNIYKNLINKYEKQI